MTTLAGINTPPTANAGSDRIVETIDNVNLDGFGSNANDLDQTLTYNWQQVSGISVTLSANDIVNPVFETPPLLPGDASIELEFSLVVNDGIEDSAPDSVTFIVEPYPATKPLFNAVVVNRFLDPAGTRSTLGDFLFTPDGSQVHLIVDSEGEDGRVLIADVIRDTQQNVIGFGQWAELFAKPEIDTGLTYAPDSDTLLYFVEDEGIAQRTVVGVEEIYTIVNYESGYGGLTVIPDIYTNAGKLLKAEYDAGRLFLHDMTNDGDDTFTILPGTLQTQLPLDSTGDIEYITDGLLANHIVVAGYDYADSSIYLVPVDPVSGLPNSNPITQVLAAGNDEVWGLSIDPISGNLWLIEYGDYMLTQYKLDDLIFKSGLDESSVP